MGKAAPDPEDQRLTPTDPAAFGHATNIDRRQCSRVVPLELICLGVSRTGTTSLRQALIDLGYKDCYHFTALLAENPRDMEMWVEAFENKFEGKGKPYDRSDWDKLLGHCRAITDTPCTVFYEDLLEAYPDQKIVLTVRDTDTWFKSTMATLMPFFKNYVTPPKSLYERFERIFWPIDPLVVRFNALLLKHYELYAILYQDYLHGTTHGKQWYERYNEHIKRIIPKERLLVTSVQEGWAPLCKFLGQEEPLYPFPRKYDRNEFQRDMDIFSSILKQGADWNMLKTAGMVVGGIGVATAAFVAHRYCWLH